MMLLFRKLFPKIAVKFEGLEARQVYGMWLEIRRVDNYK